MKFSTFIRQNLDPIIEDWERFARTLLPSAQTMSVRALRDHSRQMLLAVAADMETRETDAERARKSRGWAPQTVGSETAATVHGALRHHSGFDLVQLVAEFRAMRASVLDQWQRSDEGLAGPVAMEEIARFNEAIDQALAESVDSYSTAVATSRDMFLAILGHDLRSPLHGIDMSAAVLLGHDLSEEERHKAALRIRRASKTMGQLVNDLLDYTRARLGSGIPIEKARCDMRRVCTDAVDAVQAAFPARTFVPSFSGDLTIDADAGRMDQALSNLLNNAVQHGDPSQPVSLSAAGSAASVEIRVRNAGTPIPQSALQSIFEPLVQAPADVASDARSKTSLGLGLFIVQQIALGHGGTVGVESSEESGTQFTLSLPRAPSDAP
jgi:signal transduction histidine kinase